MKKIGSLVLVCSIMASMITTGFAAVQTKTDNTSVPGWSVELSKADGGAVIDSEEKYSGSSSMKMTNMAPSDNGGYLRVSYPVTVKPGHKYVYGFKAKIKNGQGAYAQINWIRTALGYLNPTGNTADWRDFEFSFVNGEDTTAYLRFILEKGAQYVWIDDVYFYDVDLPKKQENNLIKNPSFEGAATTATGNEKKDIIPVEMKNDVVLDGELTEWEDNKAYNLEIYTDYTQEPQTVSGDIKYAWDEENFYFALDVEDDAHFPITTGSYWNGDGLQFTICGKGDAFGTAYGLVFDEENNSIIKFGDTAIEAGIKRSGTKTVYEVAIPWSSYFGEIPDVALFCSIVNDNDNDGKGRRGCIDVAPGISMYKGSQLFPKMMLLRDDSEFTALFQGSTSVNTGENGIYTVDLYNSTNSEKQLRITSNASGVDETVSVGAKQSYTFEFEKKLTGYGTVNVDVTVSDEKDSMEMNTETEVCPNADITKKIIKTQKDNFAELSDLMAKCEQKNIPIEYQKVKYNTIEIFIDYLEEDLKDNDLSRITHQDKVMTKLYDELKSELNGLLDGTITPVSVPKYVTSPIEVVGNHFEATTQREDGTTEKRPVFFIGAGHWAASRVPEEVEKISKVGFNCMQPEIGPWDAMTEARSAKDWAYKGLGTYHIQDSITDKESKTGKSLKIVSTEPMKSNNYVYFRQTVKVGPNTKYEYGISCKGKNVNGVYYTVADIGDKAMRKYITGTYDWRDEKNEFTTGGNQTSATFLFLIEDTVDELYLDDAFIKKQGTDNNLLVNGNFEESNPDGQEYAMEEYVVKSLKETFDSCDKFNVSGIYSAAPHYVPSFMLSKYPEITISEQYGNFSKQDPRNTELQKMYEVFYKSLIPRIKDNESFDGVVLANEPQYNTSLSQDAFIVDFQNAMRDKYQNIEDLNARWGTQYTSFDEVGMPTKIEATARFYDWREYNDTILPMWIKHISDCIKSVDSDVFTSVKVMDTFGKTSNFRVTGSNNYEVLSNYTDINGCDAWSLIDTYDVRWKNVFYDFLSSVKNAPIYNTEDHIIIDASTLKYNDKEVKYNIVDCWNGAVHGRGGSVLWIWDRSSRTKNGTIYFNSLLTARPESIATLGKTSLDLNRLSNEVVALQNADKNIGILYSQNSVPYADEMLDIIFTLSAYMGENGQKTSFIVESELDKMTGYNTIIVPNSISVTDDTMNALNKFIDNGGTVMIIGENALTLNEYGDAHNTSIVSQIKNRSTVIPVEDAGTTIASASKKQIGDAITELVAKKGLNPVSIIDKSTGTKLVDSDYIVADYNGSYIVNLCSYDWNDKEIEIYVNGNKITSCEDLINFNKYEDTVKLEGYTPILLKISK